MKGKNEDALKLFGAKGTKQVLESLEHGTTQRKEMGTFVCFDTLDLRLRELLRFGLVNHHIERKPKKREWYSLTEKGRRALQHVRALTKIHTLIGAKGTKHVLEFLDEHDGARFIEIGESMNLATLNYRLRDLLSLGLVIHCFERNPRKREWYEITEKGREALRCMRALIELTADSI